MQLPLKIQILKAFIDNHEDRLTLAEIAKYCNTSSQSISYQLNQMQDTLLITKDHNTITDKTYYYINEFFLNEELRNGARDQLQPFAAFFTEHFVFDNHCDDQTIEYNLIEFITTIAWLFANGHKDAQKDFASSP